MLAQCHQNNGSKWHVLRTKPRKERLVVSQLRLRDVEVYHPTYSRSGSATHSKYESAFFPGYVFVRADLDQVGSSSLKWIPGLHGLVHFGGQPAVIAEHMMASLRARLSSFQTSIDEGIPRWKKGDSVCVTRGPFSGYSALFDAHLPGRERVRVLLSLLRSHVDGDIRRLPLELDVSDIGKRQGRRRGRRRH